MAFHKSSMGRFGDRLPTDLNGLVPQEGDTPDMFSWDPRTVWTQEAWSLYVDQAVQATLRAEEQLRLASERVEDDLVLAAADIASRAREGRVQEDREILLSLRALVAQAQRLANLFASRQKVSGYAHPQADEFEQVLGRLHAMLRKVEVQAP